MATVIILIILTLIIVMIDHIYHLKEVKEIRLIQSVGSIKEAKIILKKFRPKQYDAVLGPLQLIAAWLVIVAVIIIAWKMQQICADLLAVWVIASQLRFLEELSHMAIHGSLGGSKKNSFFWANIFFQLPMLKPNISTRHYRHCIEHHPNVNCLQKEPGLQDFIQIGFVPGISYVRFWSGVFYPMTARGIVHRIKSILKNIKSDFSDSRHVAARWFTISITVTPFFVMGWWYGFVMFYLFPLLIVFPQFYWFSQIVEHRWFVDINGLDRINREMESCRRTEYEGLLGSIIALSFFPVGDRFHMAHSLFPPLRWNYLREVDALMNRSFSGYAKNTSRGLFFGANEKPSATSHLKNIMIKGK